MRRSARVDANQSHLVAALRSFASVAVTSAVGKGFPDIVVGYRGRNYLFEIKDPKKPPSARRLTEHESDWHRLWLGQVHVVETLDDCLRVMQADSQQDQP